MVVQLHCQLTMDTRIGSSATCQLTVDTRIGSSATCQLTVDTIFEVQVSLPYVHIQQNNNKGNGKHYTKHKAFMVEYFRGCCIFVHKTQNTAVYIL